jgi:DNA-binding IclR family transcriptional regulator
VERVIQVLHRASHLISLLGSRARPWALHELAQTAGLPPSTCVRLLHDLVALGWADQSAPRGGYHLGPRASALSATAPYRGTLIAAARPLLAELAAGADRMAHLIALRGLRRQILAVAGDAAGLEALSEDDGLYGKASGRLLLALLPAPRRRQALDRLGLPSAAQWRGLATRRELESALAEIRRERRCALRQDGWHGEAVALRDGADGWLALGIAARTPLSAEVGTALVSAARRLERLIRSGG